MCGVGGVLPQGKGKAPLLGNTGLLKGHLKFCALVDTGEKHPPKSTGRHKNSCVRICSMLFVRCYKLRDTNCTGCVARGWS